jgi:tripartite-type tricarboxylate transporter receptor subunit TctC
VPKKTPDAVINKLHQNTVKSLQTPDITERMAKLGAEQMIMTPREFDVYIKNEIGINAALVKAAKINVN